MVPDNWESQFVKKLKQKAPPAVKETLEEKYSKHAAVLFDLMEGMAANINASSEEPVVFIHRTNHSIILTVRQLYLSATLNSRGKISFSSNGSVLPFTRASLIDEKWVYQNNDGTWTELSRDSLRYLFEDAFRHV